MVNEFAMDIIQQAVRVTLILAAPLLLGALVVGIMVSLFQAVTQINEQTLSFIPKILAMVGILVICGPWMIETMTSFTRELFIDIPNLVRIH